MYWGKGRVKLIQFLSPVPSIYFYQNVTGAYWRRSVFKILERNNFNFANMSKTVLAKISTGRTLASVKLLLVKCNLTFNKFFFLTKISKYKLLEISKSKNSQYFLFSFFLPLHFTPRPAGEVKCAVQNFSRVCTECLGELLQKLHKEKILINFLISIAKIWTPNTKCKIQILSYLFYNWH